MIDLPVKLNEQMRVDLKFNNFWAILVSIIIAVSSFVVTYFGVIRSIDKIDGKIDLLTQSVNNHIQNEEKGDTFTEVTINNLKISINEVWKQLITLNTLHNR